jgi:hypothetical protein
MNRKTLKSPDIQSSLYKIAKEEIIKTNHLNNQENQSNKRVITIPLLSNSQHRVELSRT